MLGNKFIVVVALCAGLTACGGGGASVDDPNHPSAPSTTANNSGAKRSTDPADIGKLPLAQGLPLKYSRLQLICWTHDLVPLGQNSKGNAWTESDSGHQVKWDLLKEPVPTKTLTIAQSSGRANYQVTLAANVGLETGTYESSDGKTYLFKKAAKISGQISSVVQFVDAKGQVLSDGRGSGSPGSTALEENIETTILDQNMTDPATGDKYAVTVKCTLEGDVKPPYDKDSSLLN